MKAFKLYFKIFKRSALPASILYLIMFSIVAIAVVKSHGGGISQDFTAEKCKVAIINNDNSNFSYEFEKYITDNSKIVDIKTDEQGIKDSLFFRTAEYIITIPDGFGEAFMNKTPINLETRILPDSTSGIFMDIMVNNYLKTFNLYLKGADKLTFEQIVENVNSDLNIKATVRMSDSKITSELDSMSVFFNYAAYPLMCVNILCISIVMLIINNKDIRRRNLCAPFNSTNFSLQVFLGNALITIALWAVYIIYALVLFKEDMFTMRGLFMSLNQFFYVLTCLSISFLISSVASKNAIHPICNIVALGCSFMGGAFVPQYMLSDTVKHAAVIDPMFWYVKANDIIATLSVFDLETLKPVLMSIGIELGFAAAVLAITLVIIKHKRTSN